MKKKIIIILILAAVLIPFFAYNMIADHFRTIDADRVHGSEITVQDEQVICSGNIGISSIHGDYSKYKYRIKGDALFIKLYCDNELTDMENEFSFTIKDPDIGEANEIYMEGAGNEQLVWKR